MKRLYHLHTPKTGGHWVDSKIILPLENALKKANIELIADHAGWYHVTDQTYIISSWRDPAQRTVSHFFHHKNKFMRDNTYATEDEFMSWIQDNSNLVQNYQSKSLLYMPKKVTPAFFYANDPIFLSIKPNIENVKERLSRINILFKEMTDRSANAIIKQIVEDLNLNESLVNFNNEININDNHHSRAFWENISDELKEYLYKLNPLDSEIYFDNSNYWFTRKR